MVFASKKRSANISKRLMALGLCLSLMLALSPNIAAEGLVSPSISSNLARISSVNLGEPIVYTTDETGKAFEYALLTPHLKDVPDEQCIVISVLGDGFTEGTPTQADFSEYASQQDVFNEYASIFAQYLYSIDPFVEFTDRLKIYRINVVSNESGVDLEDSENGVTGTKVDTYFDGTFWSGGMQRLAVGNSNKVLSTAKECLPFNDWSMLLLNSTVYGGSGGSISVTSLNTSFLDMCVHEFGHTAANLLDEYSPGLSYLNALKSGIHAKPNAVYKDFLNVLDTANYGWSRFMGKDGIGTYTYEGETDFFRPHQTCKMRYLGKDEVFYTTGTDEYPFCLVCQEAMRDALAKATNNSYLHFQPYNDNYYTHTDFTFDNKQIILREVTPRDPITNTGDLSKKYGENAAVEDNITFSIKDSTGNPVYTDHPLTDAPLNFADPGEYTIDITYDDGVNEPLTCTGTFTVHPVTIIVSTNLPATRKWDRQATALPTVIFNPELAGYTSLDQFDITYSWHEDDGDGGAGAQVGSTGTWGGATAPGPSMVGKYVLQIHIETVDPNDNYSITNTFPFEITVRSSTADRYTIASSTYSHEQDGYYFRPIIIQAEGFAEDDYDAYLQYAEDFITKFLSTVPVNGMMERFHFFILDTLSKDSGISKPGQQIETFYGLTLGADGEFGTYRDGMTPISIINTEVQTKYGGPLASAYYPSNVVLVNEKNITAYLDHRINPASAVHRSGHFTTLTDEAIQHTIESVILHHAYYPTGATIGDELFENRWMGDAEKTETIRQRLIYNAWYNRFPVIYSDAASQTYYTGSDYDVQSSFAAYVQSTTSGVPIKLRTTSGSWNSITYYADDGMKVGASISKPDTAGTYWAMADLKNGSYTDEADRSNNNQYRVRGFVRFELIQPETYGVEFVCDGVPYDTKWVTQPATTVDDFPENPEIEGYHFNGWYTGENGTGLLFTDQTEVTGDMRVYAYLTESEPEYAYTVTFITLDDGEPVIKSVVAPETTVDALPQDPDREGYIFIGWFTERDGEGEAFTVLTAVDDDIVVYAHWEALPTYAHTVTFMNGNSVYASTDVVIPATTISIMPEDPTMDGYIFRGWYTGEDGHGELFNELYSIYSDMTVYAYWEEEIVSYTVSFMSNGELYTTKEVISPETTIDALPVAPVTNGYTFYGWYTMENGQGALFSTSTAVDADITLYAYWVAVVYVEEADNGNGSGGTSNLEEISDVPIALSDGSINVKEAKDWPSIEKALNEAEEGSVIAVNLSSISQVPQEIFQAIAGRDVELVVNMDGGAKWTANGNDIPAGANISGLNFAITLNTSNIPEDILAAFEADEALHYMEFTLAHDGPFGFAMTLSIALGGSVDGQLATLYYYNESTGTLEPTDTAIVQNGVAAFTMNHASSYVIVLSAAENDWENPFTDVSDNDWFYPAVKYVCEKGLFTGTSESAFSPRATMTRGMMVTVLYRMAGSPTAGESYFTDVPTGMWYTDAVNWAASNQVASGVGDNRFAPDAMITREQMAVMLFNYAKAMGIDLPISRTTGQFSDADAINIWAVEAVNAMYMAEILNGKADGVFDPGGNATRSEVATMFMNFQENTK